MGEHDAEDMYLVATPSPADVLGHEIEEDPTPVEKSSACVTTTLIAYDLHAPKGALYDQLVGQIMSLGGWWHHFETIWIVKSVHPPGEIRDQLKPYIGSDDQLLVIDITGDVAEAVGLNRAGTAWLQETLSGTVAHS